MAQRTFLATLVAAAALEVAGQASSNIAFNWWLRAIDVNNLSVVIVSDVFIAMLFLVAAAVVVWRLVRAWNGALEARAAMILRSNAGPGMAEGETASLRSVSMQRGEAGVAASSANVATAPLVDAHPPTAAAAPVGARPSDGVTAAEAWSVFRRVFAGNGAALGWLLLAGCSDCVLSLCETYSAGHVSVLTQLFIKAAEPVVTWLVALRWRGGEKKPPRRRSRGALPAAAATRGGGAVAHPDVDASINDDGGGDGYGTCGNLRGSVGSGRYGAKASASANDAADQDAAPRDSDDEVDDTAAAAAAAERSGHGAGAGDVAAQPDAGGMASYAARHVSAAWRCIFGPNTCEPGLAARTCGGMSRRRLLLSLAALVCVAGGIACHFALAAHHQLTQGPAGGNGTSTSTTTAAPAPPLAWSSTTATAAAASAWVLRDDPPLEAELRNGSRPHHHRRTAPTGGSSASKHRDAVGFVIMYTITALGGALYAVAFGRYIFVVRRVAANVDPVDLIDLHRGVTLQHVTEYAPSVAASSSPSFLRDGAAHEREVAAAADMGGGTATGDASRDPHAGAAGFDATDSPRMFVDARGSQLSDDAHAFAESGARAPQAGGGGGGGTPAGEKAAAARAATPARAPGVSERAPLLAHGGNAADPRPHDGDDGGGGDASDEDEAFLAVAERDRSAHAISAADVRVVACALETTVALLLSLIIAPVLELMPGGVGGSTTFDEMVSRTGTGIRALGAAATLLPAAITMAGWVAVYAADSVLNHLSAPLTSLVSQVAAPLTAALLLAAPALDPTGDRVRGKVPNPLDAQLALKAGSVALVLVGSVLMYVAERLPF